MELIHAHECPKVHLLGSSCQLFDFGLILFVLLQLFFKAAQLQPDEPGFWKNTAITARLAGNKALEKYAAEKFMLLTRKK